MYTLQATPIFFSFSFAHVPFFPNAGRGEGKSGDHDLSLLLCAFPAARCLRLFFVLTCLRFSVRTKEGDRAGDHNNRVDGIGSWRAIQHILHVGHAVFEERHR